MGFGYKGDTGHHHSLRENLPILTKEYTYANGYFGTKGIGRSFVRNISSVNPLEEAQNFYDKASYGGIEKKLPNGKGLYTKLSDGTIISFREVSSSDGTPAIEINIKKSTDSSDVKYQKIHFIKEKK